MASGNVDIVKDGFDAFNSRGIDGILPMIHPEFEATTPPELASEPDTYRGHDGVRRYFADVAEQWEELVLHAEDFRLIPGSVIVIGHVTGRRDGVDIRRSSVWTWRVANGRATSVKVADLGDLAGPS